MWGSVNHASRGFLAKLPAGDSTLCTVNFDTQEGWIGDIHELEKLPETHAGFRLVNCDACTVEVFLCP